jgi:hypothetical protein
MKNEFGFAFDLDVKAISVEGEFTGYAAIFNNEDILKPSARFVILQFGNL